MKAIKMQSGTTWRSGKHSMCVTVPAAWAEDMGITVGSRVDFLRDEQDRLIVVPSAKKGGGEA